MPLFYGQVARKSVDWARPRLSSVTLSELEEAPWPRAKAPHSIGMLKRVECQEQDDDSDSDTTSRDTLTELSPEDIQLSCRWKLRAQQSVYDEALLTPIVTGHVSGFCSRTFVLTILSAYAVICINALLQFAITEKVGHLTEHKREEMSSKLWSLCKFRRADAMPFKRLLDTSPADGLYYSCGPLIVTMMSQVENVDMNHDGVWTIDEAQQLSLAWEAEYTKKANLTQVWRYFAKLAAEDPHKVNSGTQVPMAWLAGKQNAVDLCMGMNPKLCGNYEARGILEQKLPHIDDPNMRIAACEDHLEKTCPAMFGQIYKLYGLWSQELCGEISSSWLDEKGIIAVDFQLVRKYVKDRDGITTEYYFVFLVVILLIWVMCMLDEMRVIITWWLVVAFLPAKAPSGRQAVEFANGGIRVNAIPRAHKYATLLFNLLPRTVICLLLAYIGSIFLIRADDYNELILNSVALGFLIEIDNMLFAAVSREQDKEIVESCLPLEACHPRCGVCWHFHRAFPISTIFSLMILLVTYGLILHAYTKDRGKYDIGVALRCLCHAAGRGCVGAQVLGGFDSVKDFERSTEL